MIKFMFYTCEIRIQTDVWELVKGHGGGGTSSKEGKVECCVDENFYNGLWGLLSFLCWVPSYCPFHSLFFFFFWKASMTFHWVSKIIQKIRRVDTIVPFVFVASHNSRMCPTSGSQRHCLLSLRWDWFTSLWFLWTLFIISPWGWLIYLPYLNILHIAF